LARQTLETFSGLVHGAAGIEDLWRLVIAFAQSRRIVRVAVHGNVSPMEMSEVPVIRAHGFPDDWVAHYIAHDLARSDPIPALAARRTKPFFWGDTASLIRATGSEARFLEELAEADIGEGLAMQVYGPAMRSAYVGLGFGSGRPEIDGAEIFELKAGMQLAFLRYCELSEDRFVLERDLSPREAEILSWVARGKSNSIIAEIIGVSRHTVDTNIRRLFEKLGVSDRTTAVLRGFGAGLITGGTASVPRMRDRG
jgi:LuxR family transcriptional regulator/LuxR family quorum-sensing system transcriptional regulator CciR